MVKPAPGMKSWHPDALVHGGLVDLLPIVVVVVVSRPIRQNRRLKADSGGDRLGIRQVVEFIP